MILTAYIAFCLGIALESLLLWENRRRKGPERPAADIIAPGVPPERLLMGGAAALAFLLIGLVTLLGIGQQAVFIDDPLVMPVFVALGLALLYYGLLDPRLLPQVNEETILPVHTTVILSLVLTRPAGAALWPYLLGLGLPSALLLAVGIAKKPPAPMLKALIYLWYLINLFLLALQNDFSAINQNVLEPRALPETAIAGATFVFLLLHSMFLIRFALIASTFFNPHSRRYIAPTMQQLYTDEQIPLWQFLLLEALVIGIIVANIALGLAPDLTVMNVLVLLIAQGVPAWLKHRAL